MGLQLGLGDFPSSTWWIFELVASFQLTTARKSITRHQKTWRCSQQGNWGRQKSGTTGRAEGLRFACHLRWPNFQFVWKVQDGEPKDNRGSGTTSVATVWGIKGAFPAFQQAQESRRCGLAGSESHIYLKSTFASAALTPRNCWGKSKKFPILA